jgi:hypothetical protein
LSGHLIEALRRPAGSVRFSPATALYPLLPDVLLADEDLQVALWACYELHYRGFEDVEPGWEWEPSLLRWRRELERHFEAALRATVTATVDAVQPVDGPVTERLRSLIDCDDGPQLARYLQIQATGEQFREFVVHRSIYHLKEADPHSWVIPRLGGRAKTALVDIQCDEYGSGSASRMHSELFRSTMRGLELSDRYGHYLDVVPGYTLAISNLMSFFGLHRDKRGAVAGHLAMFEMTSSAPNRRYSKGLRRLGGNARARRFYDEHVTADALHEQLALHDLCGSLVRDEPELAEDVLFGAACGLLLDNLFASQLLRCWQDGRSSLRQPPAGAVAGLDRAATQGWAPALS